MTVTLAGAGCGGKGSLSLAVLEAIQNADVILYDDLISADILDIPTRAVWEYCGKRKGRHSLRQDEINDRLLQLDGQYERVLRLKGGDPFVFGRGMEEKRFLESHGVRVQMACGISSVYGVPERAGIPVTDRQHASMFTAVTASRKADGRVFAQDGKVLASLPGTLIVLMGFSVRQQIAEELINHGKDPDTPAAILSSKDISHTKVETGKLRQLGQMGKDLSAPALLVIGDVVTEYKSRPVIGFTGTTDLTARVMEHLPDMEAVQLVTRMARPLELECPEADWYVFASRGGAKQFLAAIKKKGIDLRALPGIAVIGEGTAEVFKEAGLFADLTAESSLESLADRLEEKLDLGQSIVTYRCRAADDKLEKRLEKSFQVNRVDLYDMDVMVHEDSEPEYVVFGSSLAAKTVTHGHTAVAISPVTAQAIAGFERVIIAKEASAAGIARAIWDDMQKS